MKTVQSVARNPAYAHIGTTQRAVIEDLMNGMNKYDVLAKHKVNPARYRRWLKSKAYRKAVVDRVDSVKRQHKFLALHSLPTAVEILDKLMKSDKEETARKACLDIIALQKENSAEDAASKAEREAQEQNDKLKISDEKAARMLAILAEPDEPENNQQPAPTQNQVSSTEYPVNEQPIPDRLPDRNYYAFLNRNPAPITDDSLTKYPEPSTEHPVVDEPRATSHEQRQLTPEQIAAEKRHIEADLAMRRHAENVRRMWRPARGRAKT